MGKSILAACFCIVLISCYHEDVRSCEYIECRTPEGSIFHISVYKNSDTIEYFIKNDKENEYKINYFNWSDTIVKYLNLGYKIDTNHGMRALNGYYYVVYKDKQASLDNFLRMYPNGRLWTIKNSCVCNSSNMWDRCICCEI